MSGTAVVTVVHGRSEHLARQRESLAASTTDAFEHVVVAMDDPALVASGGADAALPRAPLGLPLAAARNRGAEVALARGAARWSSSTSTASPTPSLVGAYADVVADEPDTVWSGPVTYLDPPPPGRLRPGRPARRSTHPTRHDRRRPRASASTAPTPTSSGRCPSPAPTTAWRRSGGFCEDYVGYGGEDTDFARVALVAGLDLGWVGAARAYHQWHPVSRPPVEHVDDIVRNARIFHARWGEWPMLGWLEAFEERGLVVRDRRGPLVAQPLIRRARAPRRRRTTWARLAPTPSSALP